jgi:hypothetical protein
MYFEKRETVFLTDNEIEHHEGALINNAHPFSPISSSENA